MTQRIRPEDYFTPEEEKKTEETTQVQPIIIHPYNEPIKAEIPPQNNGGIIQQFLSEIFQELFKPVIPCMFGLRLRCRIYSIMERYRNK